MNILNPIFQIFLANNWVIITKINISNQWFKTVLAKNML
jgi:hypothetical protein